MLHIIAASIAFLAVLAPPQEQEIPPLTKDIVLELLRFELPDVDPELLLVLDVNQLDELGRANVRVRTAEATVKLKCLLTDFGPKWRLAEPLLPELKNAGKPEPATSETKPAIPQDNQSGTQTEPEKPDESIPVESYKSVLEKLFSDLRAEREENYAGYYFRDEDFDLAAVAAEGDPVQELADKRAEFLRQCLQLSLQLKDAEQFNTISFFATRSSAGDRAQLHTLMPQARRYIKAVSVEIMVDGRLGTVVFEGLILMPDGWRLGGIANVEIAQEGGSDTPLPQ